jgi:hypothetical protein
MKVKTDLGHVTRMGEMRNAYKILAIKSEERNYLGDQDVNGGIILKWIF